MKNKEQTQTASAYKEKRLVLSSISQKMKRVREARTQQAQTNEEGVFWQTRTINQMLMKVLYNKSGDLVFNTFGQWKKEGATIKKGSKAVMIWGQPRISSKEKEKKHKSDPTEFDEFEFFPLCYLFSSEDVILPKIQTEPEPQEVELPPLEETFELN